MKRFSKILSVLLAALLCCGVLVPAFALVEPDPACDHVWEQATDPARLGADGRTYLRCTKCGGEKDEETLHYWVWITDQNPTCGVPGKKHQVCGNCTPTVVNESSVDTEIAPTGQHTLEWVLDLAPTCGEEGIEHQYCTVCGLTFNENTVIQPTGEHNFVWVVDTAATCGKAGLKHKECAVCHQWEEDGVYESIPRTNKHNWVWTIDTAPTCGVQGVKHEQCSVCNEKRNEGTAVAATENHAWQPVDDARNRPSTCTREGTQVYICSVCGHEKADAIPKAPHVDNNGDDKCDNCGVYTGSGTGVSGKSVWNRFIDFFWGIWERIRMVFTGEVFK